MINRFQLYDAHGIVSGHRTYAAALIQAEKLARACDRDIDIFDCRQQRIIHFVGHYSIPDDEE